MRAIHYTHGAARYRDDYPQPVPKSGEALIKVTLAALCNTDREILRDYSPGFSGVMGHEFVGVVEDAADTSLVGRRVVGEINLSCFRDDCLYCGSHRDHHCLNRSVLGIIAKDGCFADYITLPEHLLHVIPDSLADQAAIFAEPLAAAFRIVEQSSIEPDTPVALVGDGRLAYMIGQVIASTGADLTVYGKEQGKLELFAPFATVHLVDDLDLGAPHDTYEIVIDATGSPSSLATSIALTRSEGLLVMKSTYAEKAEIDMSEIVVRELTIRGSRCGPFEPALDYLERGLITLPPVEIFAPEDFKEALASPAFKVALDFS
jgi:threonine dehydrogenase-like Zn-dependent dehydrogenase